MSADRRGELPPSSKALHHAGIRYQRQWQSELFSADEIVQGLLNSCDCLQPLTPSILSAYGLMTRRSQVLSLQRRVYSLEISQSSFYRAAQEDQEKFCTLCRILNQVGVGIVFKQQGSWLVVSIIFVKRCCCCC